MRIKFIKVVEYRRTSRFKLDRNKKKLELQKEIVKNITTKRTLF